MTGTRETVELSPFCRGDPAGRPYKMLLNSKLVFSQLGEKAQFNSFQVYWHSICFNTVNGFIQNPKDAL